MALLLRSAEIKPWFIRFVPLEHFSLPCQGFIWVSVFIVPRDLPEICTSPQNPCHEYISKTAQSVAIIVSFMSLLISIYLPEIYLGLGFYSALGLCFGTARACMCTAPRPPQRRAAPPRRAPWCLPQRAGRRRRVLALLCLCSVVCLSMSWVSAFVQLIEFSSPKQGYPEPESTYTPIHYFYVFSGS